MLLQWTKVPTSPVPRRWVNTCQGCGREFQVKNDSEFRAYADYTRQDCDDTLTGSDVAGNMIYCLGCSGECDDSDLLRREFYFRDLTPTERASVRRGYAEVISGALRPSWRDSRQQLRHEARLILAGVIREREEIDEDETDAACWAIGRDLATARLRK